MYDNTISSIIIYTHSHASMCTYMSGSIQYAIFLQQSPREQKKKWGLVLRLILARSAMLKFLGVEEKTCDLLTGDFCSTEEMVHAKHFKGKTIEELKEALKVLSKKSQETLKKDERYLVDERLKVGKKLLKALKKSKGWWNLPWWLPWFIVPNVGSGLAAWNIRLAFAESFDVWRTAVKFNISQLCLRPSLDELCTRFALIQRPDWRVKLPVLWHGEIEMLQAHARRRSIIVQQLPSHKSQTERFLMQPESANCLTIQLGSRSCWSNAPFFPQRAWFSFTNKCFSFTLTRCKWLPYWVTPHRF